LALAPIGPDGFLAFVFVLAKRWFHTALVGVTHSSVAMARVFATASNFVGVIARTAHVGVVDEPLGTTGVAAGVFVTCAAKGTFGEVTDGFRGVETRGHLIVAVGRAALG
jgi:hypothetical protein|tara:strand:- start:447 stop:776 length:330 start_codon:yes stop_codon:yes gene_type:complete